MEICLELQYQKTMITFQYFHETFRTLQVSLMISPAGINHQNQIPAWQQFAEIGMCSIGSGNTMNLHGI